MRAHLIVGGGDHAATVAARVAATLSTERPVVRATPDVGDPDPVVVALEAHLERVLEALDLPAPVVADLLHHLLPPEVPLLLRLARSIEQARADEQELVTRIDLEVARLFDAPQRVSRALAAFVPVVARWEALVAPEGVGSLPAPGAPVLTALREGAALLERLDAALADPEVTALHLAAPDGPAGAARRADAEVLLALMGRTLTAVHPADGALAQHLPSPALGGRPSVERHEGEWLLRVDLPGVRAADLALVRHEDEIVLTLAGRSRRMLLPSVLRRCEVERAGVADGVLTLRMSPDEAVWPRG